MGLSVDLDNKGIIMLPPTKYRTTQNITMEAYVVSAGSARITSADSRNCKYLGAVLRVQFSWMTFQCSQLRGSGRTVNVYSKRTSARLYGGPRSVTQREEVVSRSVRFCDKLDCRFEPHGYSGKVAFDTTRRCSREFEMSRSFVTRSLICAATPYNAELDVLPRNEHFQRVEEFYDVNGFLFVEDSWDTDTDEVSNSWNDGVGTLLAAAKVEHSSAILSWGGGSELIRQLSVSCPGSLVVCHCSLALLAMVKESNDDIVCWHGDIVDMASCLYGPFDSVFLNLLPALSVSPIRLLQAVAGLCKLGARIVISSTQGKSSLAVHLKKNPGIVLHDLPDFASLEKMVAGLPLKIVEFQDDSSYLAALEVTQEASLLRNLNVSADCSASKTSEIRTGNRTFKLVPNYPLRVRGHIVKGFGRGSKQMGIPTANVHPEDVSEDVLLLPRGVYCGWAQVHGGGLDGGVHKMAMNIGNRPTFADGGGVSVEVHILHDYGDVDFYGEEVSFMVLGFIREEMQFKSLGELVQRIRTDLEMATKGLGEEDMQQFAADELFLSR